MVQEDLVNQISYGITVFLITKQYMNKIYYMGLKWMRWEKNAAHPHRENNGIDGWMD